MKTIQIPTNCNPYIVVINNHVYTYKAGETVEVPDEVAEAIEDAIELAPKPKRYLSKIAQRADGSLVEVTAQDLEGITAIANYSFHDLKSIQKVTIPDSVITLGISAFYGCEHLESIRFGVNSKLNKICENAFVWCGRLTRVYLPVIPPTLVDINAFSNINAACVFYCKTQASLEAYKKAENWSTLSGTYTFTLEP